MNKEIISIKTEYIRLCDLLKFSGIAETGGMAKEIILDGLVSVDGEPCLMRGKKLYVGATVQIDLEEGFTLVVSKNED